MRRRQKVSVNGCRVRGRHRGEMSRACPYSSSSWHEWNTTFSGFHQRVERETPASLYLSEGSGEISFDARGWINYADHAIVAIIKVIHLLFIDWQLLCFSSLEGRKQRLEIARRKDFSILSVIWSVLFHPSDMRRAIGILIDSRIIKWMSE